MRLKTKHIFILFLSVLLVVSALSIPQTDASAATTKYKVVNTNSLNMRTGPGVQYKIVKKLKKNTTVTKTSTKGKWFKIKTGSTVGYVNSSYLSKVVLKVSNTNSTIGKYYSITAASLNVRKTSAATSTKLAVVKFGKQFVIKGQAKNGWYKIEYAKGKTGYVSNHYGITSVSKNNVYPKGTIFGPLSGRTFVIDPGHGGSQAGAQYFGVKEKDLNLKASKTLQKELISQGAKVVMTRSTDKTLSLDARVKISKAAKPDAYISVHHNVVVKKGEAGYLALYTKKSEKTFNKYIFNSLKSSVTKATKVPAEEYRYQNLHVLRENPYIGTLIEYGYMSRASELKKINTNAYREAMAKGIANGLESYFDKY
ncbi:MAG: N-acetylmuramoyl-L-alanine amidase [Kurthia sp.]|nr:N-acetylmuramoyl-L-alanine amidase [Candidatus Kurthia equi]